MQWPHELKLRVLERTQADGANVPEILEEYGIPRTTHLYWVDCWERGTLYAKLGRPNKLDQAIDAKLAPIEARVTRLEERDK